jgi:hypothetical protein
MFVYDSATPFLEDVGRLMDAGDGIHVLAHFTPVESSERKRVRLTVGVEFFPGEEPDGANFRDLQCSDILPPVDTDLFGENNIFYFRYADWFGTSADFVYPWVDHYFDLERAQEYLSAVMGGRFSPLFKMGVSTIIPLAKGGGCAPLLTRSRFRKPLVLVGLFPKLPSGLADLSDLVGSYSQQVEGEFGASRYLYGYANPASTNWAREFGDLWLWMADMKRRFDPANVFNPDLMGLHSVLP